MYEYTPMRMPDFQQAGQDAVSGLSAIVAMQQAARAADLDRADRQASREDRRAAEERQYRLDMLDAAAKRREEDRQAAKDLREMRAMDRRAMVEDINLAMEQTKLMRAMEAESVLAKNLARVGMAESSNESDSFLGIAELRADNTFYKLPDSKQAALNERWELFSGKRGYVGSDEVTYDAAYDMLRSGSSDQAAKGYAVLRAANMDPAKLKRLASGDVVAKGEMLLRATRVGDDTIAKEHVELAKTLRAAARGARTLGLPAYQQLDSETRKKMAAEIQLASALAESDAADFENKYGVAIDRSTGSIKADHGPGAVAAMANLVNASAFAPYQQEVARIGMSRMTDAEKQAAVAALEATHPNSPKAFEQVQTELLDIAQAGLSTSPYSPEGVALVEQAAKSGARYEAFLSAAGYRPGGGAPALALSQEFVEQANAYKQANASGGIAGANKMSPTVNEEQAEIEMKGLVEAGDYGNRTQYLMDKLGYVLVEGRPVKAQQVAEEFQVNGGLAKLYSKLVYDLPAMFENDSFSEDDMKHPETAQQVVHHRSWTSFSGEDRLIRKTKLYQKYVDGTMSLDSLFPGRLSRSVGLLGVSAGEAFGVYTPASVRYRVDPNLKTSEGQMLQAAVAAGLATRLASNADQAPTETGKGLEFLVKYMQYADRDAAKAMGPAGTPFRYQDFAAASPEVARALDDLIERVEDGRVILPEAAVYASGDYSEPVTKEAVLSALKRMKGTPASSPARQAAVAAQVGRLLGRQAASEESTLP